MRRALVRGFVAAAPAGSIADPSGLGGVAWIETAFPNTAAGALRAAGPWNWDTARRFDAEDWWWRVPLDGATGVLGLDGIATLWDAWVDGVHVASGANMYVAHDLAIAAPARELVIRCRALEPELAIKRSRPRWRVPMLEHQQLRWVRTTLLGRTPGWSPPCPAVGPWRPMWIGDARSEVAISARLEGDAGVIEVAAKIAGVTEATLVVTRDGKRTTAALAHVDGRWRGAATIANPALWWPHTHGDPARYALVIETAHGAIELGASGFRTIHVDRDNGDFAIRVNGTHVFCRGACWTPLDVVTLAASREAYRAAVAQVVAAGMNMIRIGGTMVYEDAALYDALDEHGVLLWQDLMFANMDYPDDDAFTANVRVELDQQLGRLQARPSLAIVCGNSEGEQQAAMWGADRERWAPRLFHDLIPAIVQARVPGVAYTPSSAHGGAFPHAANAGASSYYGVGAYLRPLDDARRSEVRFASECLAFANLPSALPPALRVHHPAWKARSPRDLGAGWDFDDVRDHYVQRLFGVDPAALRVADHERYLALGRAVTGEVMAQTFGEWRRARSQCRGALIWWLRDLWPGAGWGVVDATGAPKPCWYALRRALQPIAIAITDEGVNGLALHVANDRPQSLDARVELVLWRGGDIEVGRAAAEIAVPEHGAIELAAAALFDGFRDLSHAYRFGPPIAHVVHALLHVDGEVRADAFWFPDGLATPREVDVGLSARAVGNELVVTTKRFAQYVTIDASSFVPDDNNFHLAPGQVRTLRGSGVPRGTIGALNSETTARIA